MKCLLAILPCLLPFSPMAQIAKPAPGMLVYSVLICKIRPQIMDVLSSVYSRPDVVNIVNNYETNGQCVKPGPGTMVALKALIGGTIDFEGDPIEAWQIEPYKGFEFAMIYRLSP